MVLDGPFMIYPKSLELDNNRLFRLSGPSDMLGNGLNMNYTLNKNDSRLKLTFGNDYAAPKTLLLMPKIIIIQKIWIF